MDHSEPSGFTKNTTRYSTQESHANGEELSIFFQEYRFLFDFLIDRFDQYNSLNTDFTQETLTPYENNELDTVVQVFKRAKMQQSAEYRQTQDIYKKMAQMIQLVDSLNQADSGENKTYYTLTQTGITLGYLLKLVALYWDTLLDMKLDKEIDYQERFDKLKKEYLSKKQICNEECNTREDLPLDIEIIVGMPTKPITQSSEKRAKGFVMHNGQISPST